MIFPKTAWKKVWPGAIGALGDLKELFNCFRAKEHADTGHEHKGWLHRKCKSVKDQETFDQRLDTMQATLTVMQRLAASAARYDLLCIDFCINDWLHIKNASNESNEFVFPLKTVIRMLRLQGTGEFASWDLDCEQAFEAQNLPFRTG